MFNPVKVTCTCCKKEFISAVVDFCSNCAKEKIEKSLLSSFEEAKKELFPPITKWRRIKKSTYAFSLLFIPVFIIGNYFGFKIQCVSMTMFFLGVYGDEIVNYLDRIF